ncbi:hypothetical protein RB195_011059 [Necator americanus]|uniref:Uncharacterized protein n=1 Tax=Necator americanus TaxID=51031 RepID=A0ABR1D0N7_NECAM
MDQGLCLHQRDELQLRVDWTEERIVHAFHQKGEGESQEAQKYKQNRCCRWLSTDIKLVSRISRQVEMHWIPCGNPSMSEDVILLDHKDWIAIGLSKLLPSFVTLTFADTSSATATPT